MARSETKRCEFCGHWYIRPCTVESQAACGNTKLATEAQVSIRHHYIPVFYSKRWCGNDGKVCEYSRSREKIYDRRVVPKGTGFQDRLYETKGVPKQIAQRIEDDFMSSVDNHAAEALKLLGRRPENQRRPETQVGMVAIPSFAAHADARGCRSSRRHLG